MANIYDVGNSLMNLAGNVINAIGQQTPLEIAKRDSSVSAAVSQAKLKIQDYNQNIHKITDPVKGWDDYKQSIYNDIIKSKESDSTWGNIDLSDPIAAQMFEDKWLELNDLENSFVSDFAYKKELKDIQYTHQQNIGNALQLNNALDASQELNRVFQSMESSGMYSKEEITVAEVKGYQSLWRREAQKSLLHNANNQGFEYAHEVLNTMKPPEGISEDDPRNFLNSESKTSLHEWLDSEELKYKEQLKVQQDETYSKGFTMITENSFTSADQIVRECSKNGKFSILNQKQRKDMLYDFFWWQGKREKAVNGEEDKSSSEWQLGLDFILLDYDADRTDLVNYARAGIESGEMSVDDKKKVDKILENDIQFRNIGISEVAGRIKNLDEDDYGKGVQQELLDGLKNFIRMDEFGEIRKDNEKVPGPAEIHQWLDNQLEPIEWNRLEGNIGTVYDKYRDYRRDISFINDFEQVDLDVENGKLIGLAQPELIMKHFNNPDINTKDSIKSDISKNMFGYDYENLTENQMKQVDANMTVLDLAEAQRNYTATELNIPTDKIRVLLDRNGNPQFQDMRNAALYEIKVEGNVNTIYRYVPEKDQWDLFKGKDIPLKKPDLNPVIPSVQSTQDKVNNALGRIW